MKQGDIVLAAFQQADGQVKNRPAVLLRIMPGFGDFLVCAVSRQLHQEVPGFDDPILQAHPDFSRSGLTGPSLVLLGFLAVLPKADVLGAIGSISQERHQKLFCSDWLTSFGKLDTLKEREAL